jgi:transcriptional regulator GlxA family with amidase domain
MSGSGSGEPAPSRLEFLLIDDFALLSYASVAEAFRAANILSGRRLYSWRHRSVTGEPAQASNGLALMVDGLLGASEPTDFLFVFAGGNPAEFRHRRTLQRLRDAAARGAAIVGVSGGAYLLARAGLLDGYRCTIHWEHEPAFREAFPNLALERSLFVIDRARLTCAGGTAGLDLAVEIIRRAHGASLAMRVGVWFIQSQAREGGGEQRAAIGQRYRTSSPNLLAALRAMESSIGDPLRRAQLAKIAGVSLRQLERLFSSQLHRTIGQQYVELRLDAAQRLLRETELSRTEVAIACGFANVSHFSRAFRIRFGEPPSRYRSVHHSARHV